MPPVVWNISARAGQGRIGVLDARRGRDVLSPGGAGAQLAPAPSARRSRKSPAKSASNRPKIREAVLASTSGAPSSRNSWRWSGSARAGGLQQQQRAKAKQRAQAGQEEHGPAHGAGSLVGALLRLWHGDSPKNTAPKAPRTLLRPCPRRGSTRPVRPGLGCPGWPRAAAGPLPRTGRAPARKRSRQGDGPRVPSDATRKAAPVVGIFLSTPPNWLCGVRPCRAARCPRRRAGT